MTTDELILELIRRRVALIPQREGRLTWDGPAGAMSPEILAALREHKREILHRMAAAERARAAGPEAKR